MGRPRGKGKKPAAEFLSNDDDGGGEEPAPTTEERSGRLREHDAGEVDDIAKVEEDMDGDPNSTAKTESKGGTKRPRRRRVKRSSALAEGEEKDGDRVRVKVEGFRRTGSRRKSTPRRAAEAGVECVE
ncbi:uncharacterized protein LOC104583731 [Brachypodium distachyon]|uniref:Uncharacterized protein n=1 Tax=Brachypodium distachyon TaxID=15368 RepID=A0A0Q3HZD6_BRADI|nr:uncharacterized protein LOC104583731 [Brachypodium distachyon]KQJ98928.1 hypothetical protein BRADI_3g40041v3 [Brachypodium distachyon]|eukprot:XP_014756040.1 uncharacterized protein LOC104583731 [Brachypodium distachyon]